jgi:thiol-disulfide isomerase/thioredoxin
MGEDRNTLFQTFQPVDKIQNNEALFFVQLYRDNPDLRINNVQEQKEVKEGIFHVKSEARYNRKVAYLENQKQNVSNLFFDLCKKFFRVEYLNDLLYLYEQEKGKKIEHILLRDKEYTQYDDLFFSRAYRNFCSSYDSLLNSDSNLTDYACIKNDFSGKIRDYFLFNLIKKNKNEESLKTFFNDCQDEEYQNYLRRELNVKEKLLSSKDLLIQADLSQISLEDMLSKYKGKVVYVDIWASWCRPCRKLLPKSHQLKEQFKEDVAFVYLSVDENVGQWENAVRNEHLDENNSYLISEKSSFIKEHEIIGKKGIPYYFIFDRTGKLIVDDAMRPDNRDFIEKMNHHLIHQ